jgi:hypothetical protein
MRKARDWYFLEFNPDSVEDFNKTLFSENSGHMRMVASYWDMAAALVNHDAISLELFNDTNGEHISVFSKLEPFLEEVRASMSPQFLVNLEKLVDATPNGRQRSAAARERVKAIRARVQTRRNNAAAAEA